MHLIIRYLFADEIEKGNKEIDDTLKTSLKISKVKNN